MPDSPRDRSRNRKRRRRRRGMPPPQLLQVEALPQKKESRLHSRNKRVHQRLKARKVRKERRERVDFLMP